MSPLHLFYRGLWRWRLPLALLLLIVVVTALALHLVFRAQTDLLLEQERRSAEDELTIIASFSREALARGDYASVARFAEGYAREHSHVIALRMETVDGTIRWLDYRQDEMPTADSPVRTLSRRVKYGAGQELRLAIELSGHETEAALVQLRRYLLLVGAVAVLLFTLGLWLSVEQMGIRPLRRARDELERRVDERTEELQNALAQLSEKAEELERRATHDHLTGLFNRLRFEESLEQETERANRYGQPFSLILCDADHFKRVNDTYGHPVGDDVLVELAQRLSRGVRKIDQVARWGGEEFVVLLPETDLSSASEMAERLRRQVADTPFPSAGELTISLGVAEYRPGDSRQSLLLRVDQALYAAKQEGRNRVVAQPADGV